jgi:hypothetical protein
MNIGHGFILCTEQFVFFIIDIPLLFYVNDKKKYQKYLILY